MKHLNNYRQNRIIASPKIMESIEVTIEAVPKKSGPIAQLVRASDS